MKESIVRPYIIGAFFLLGFILALSPMKAKAQAFHCDGTAVHSSHHHKNK